MADGTAGLHASSSSRQPQDWKIHATKIRNTITFDLPRTQLRTSSLARPPTQCVERLAQHSSPLAPSSSLCHGEQDCAPLLLRTRGRKQTHCQRPSTSGRCCPATNTPRRHCACLCHFWLCSGDSSLLRFGRASTTSLLSSPFLTSLDTTLLQPER